LASGALATVADEVTGIEIFGWDGPAPAAAKLADEGGAAGVKPATATACGVVCADGKVGSAERATIDESGALSCFHHAQRGPDWQPESTANAAIMVVVRVTVKLMSFEVGK
jgi:hypothetical protein